MPSFDLPSARVEASRRNGAKSKGPKTSEGKARSAQNALRHGLRAQKHVVLPDEDTAEFAALEQAIVEELAPEGALQMALAQRVVAATWRLARAERIESELFAIQGEDPVRGWGRLGLALIRDCNGAGAFATLLRYRGGTLAELWRALRTLKALQAERHVHEVREAAHIVPPDEPEYRRNPDDSIRPDGRADADGDPAPAWLPSWPLPTPGPAACVQPIKPEMVTKPGSAPRSLLDGTALVPLSRCP